MKTSSLIRLQIVIAGIALSAASAMCNAQQYDFVDLGLLPGFIESHGEGINDLGQACGFSYDENGLLHAYLWESGVLTDLGTLGGLEARAYGINNLGQITGYADTPQSYRHAFVWENGVMTDLGSMQGEFAHSFGRRITDTGLSCGTGEGALGLFHAYFHDGRDWFDLGTLGDRHSTSWARDLNESGQVVGASQIHISGPAHAFLWEADVLTDLGTLGGSTSQANGINEAGTVVGFAYNETEHERGFILKPGGVMTDIGAFGNRESSLREINEAGVAVGYSMTPQDDRHAAVYTDGVLYDLNYLAEIPDGWMLYGARDINENGWIVGAAKYNGLFRAYLLIPSDDPFTLSAGPLIGGSTAQLTVTGARPDSRITLAYSLDGVGYVNVPKLGAAVHLENPERAGRMTTTDANGTAMWELKVPDHPGHTVWFQAIQDGLVSNVVSGEIE